MITIIDYDAGNLRSVENALQFLGEEAKITRDSQEILKADKVILPGVGAFGDAMEKLHKYNLVSVIREVNEKQIPFLGICLGLQLLFEESDETPGVKGLGVLPGKIKAIPPKKGFKIPHMGWNSIQIKEGARLFQGIPQDAYVFCSFLLFTGCKRGRRGGNNRIYRTDPYFGRKRQHICVPVSPGEEWRYWITDIEELLQPLTEWRGDNYVYQENYSMFGCK